MTFPEYLSLVSRLGVKRSEIDLWLLDKGHLLAPRRREVMSNIAELLGEADVALYMLQRRVELLSAELHNKDKQLKRSQESYDRLVNTIL